MIHLLYLLKSIYCIAAYKHMSILNSLNIIYVNRQRYLMASQQATEVPSQPVGRPADEGLAVTREEYHIRFNYNNNQTYKYN